MSLMWEVAAVAVTIVKISSQKGVVVSTRGLSSLWGGRVRLHSGRRQVKHVTRTSCRRFTRKQGFQSQQHSFDSRTSAQVPWHTPDPCWWSTMSTLRNQWVWLREREGSTTSKLKLMPCLRKSDSPSTRLLEEGILRCHREWLSKVTWGKDRINHQ